MTAKEMFEALGYKQTANSDDVEAYDYVLDTELYKIKYTGVNHENGDYAYICFYLMHKEYEIGYSNRYQIETKRVVIVTIKEHEAITKQMKELGWIVEPLKEGDNNDL